MIRNKITFRKKKIVFVFFFNVNVLYFISKLNLSPNEISFQKDKSSINFIFSKLIFFYYFTEIRCFEFYLQITIIFSVLAIFVNSYS